MNTSMPTLMSITKSTAISTAISEKKLKTIHKKSMKSKKTFPIQIPTSTLN